MKKIKVDAKILDLVLTMGFILLGITLTLNLVLYSKLILK